MIIKPVIHTTQQAINEAVLPNTILCDEQLQSVRQVGPGDLTLDVVPSSSLVVDYNIMSSAYGGSNSFLQPYSWSNISGTYKKVASSTAMFFRALEARSLYDEHRPFIGLSETSLNNKSITAGCRPSLYAANLNGQGFLGTFADPGTTFTTNEPFIIEGWYKPTQNLATGQCIFSWLRSDDAPGLKLSLSADGTDSLALYLRSGAYDTEITFADVFPADDKFHHYRVIASLYYGSWKYQLYIDGVIKGSSSWFYPDIPYKIWLDGTLGGYLAEFKLWWSTTTPPGAWNSSYNTIPSSLFVYLTSIKGLTSTDTISTQDAIAIQRFLVNRGQVAFDMSSWMGYDLANGRDYRSVPLPEYVLSSINMCEANGVASTNLSFIRRSYTLTAVTFPLLRARGLANNSTFTLTRNSQSFLFTVNNGNIWFNYGSADTEDRSYVGRVIENTLLLDDDVLFGNLSTSEIEDGVFSITLERRIQTLFISSEYPVLLNGTHRTDIYDWSDPNKIETKIPFTDAFLYSQDHEPVLRVVLQAPLEKTIYQRAQIRTRLDI